MIKISVQYLKIAMLYLKISGRYLKISGLKIAVHSLKIAGLKIIARVCVYVRMWVRMCVCGCAPHLAEVSKIVQDATRAGTQRPERPPITGTQATTTSTGAGAPPNTGTQATTGKREEHRQNKICY